MDIKSVRGSGDLHSAVPDEYQRLAEGCGTASLLPCLDWIPTLPAAATAQEFRKQAIQKRIGDPACRKKTPRIGDFENCGAHEEDAESSSSSGDHSCDITPSKAHSCWHWHWPWPLAAEAARPPVPRPLADAATRHRGSRRPAGPDTGVPPVQPLSGLCR
jgi:hypothetical protein